MSFNSQKLRAVLSKWPVTFPKKEYDYGYRLRELLKNKTDTEEIFPGTSAENSRKLDALMRLANNSAKSEFSISAKLGASGFECTEIKDLLFQQLHMTEKK